MVQNVREAELLKESLAVILSLQDIIHPQREFKAVQQLREEIEEITKLSSIQVDNLFNPDVPRPTGEIEVKGEA